MKKKYLAVMALSLLMVATFANADSITYSPTPVEKSIGEIWNVGIYLNGTISADPFAGSSAVLLSYFYLEFSYHPDVIEFSNVIIGSWAPNGWEHSITTNKYGDDYDHIKIQINGPFYPFEGKKFTNELFATIVFDAVGPGTSTFNNSGSGAGASGGYVSYSFYSSNPGIITVSGVASIPEPNTILLLGSGLIGIAGLRRKFKA